MKRKLPRTGGVARLGWRPGHHPHPHLAQPPNIQIQPEAGCKEQVVRATGPPLGLCSNVTLDVETQFQCPERPFEGRETSCVGRHFLEACSGLRLPQVGLLTAAGWPMAGGCSRCSQEFQSKPSTRFGFKCWPPIAPLTVKILRLQSGLKFPSQAV